jgi:hypothetical protein
VTCVAVLLLCVIALWYILIEHGCNRGRRVVGVSWFDIAHEMRGTSKKAKGRMQQRKRRR